MQACLGNCLPVHLVVPACLLQACIEILPTCFTRVVLDAGSVRARALTAALGVLQL